MPLQNSFPIPNLGMLGLGILNDKPPNKIQPPLLNGVHLRWMFERKQGFPLYGFYLFRRIHKQGQPVCLGRFIDPYHMGIASTDVDRLNTKVLNTAYGQFSSNRALVFTNDFAPADKVEIDLRDRDYLRFTLPPRTAARQIDATIGFYPKVTKSQVCVRFSMNDEHGPNPRTDEDVNFHVKDFDGSPSPNTTITHSGLDCGGILEIILPCPSTIVELTMTYSLEPAIVEALKEDDTVVVRVRMKKYHAGKPETLTLKGSDIKKLVVLVNEPQTLLHQICFTCSSQDEFEKEQVVRVTGFSGDSGDVGDERVVNTVKGLAGEVRSTSLKFDSITAVEFVADIGAAALLDLCLVPVSQDSDAGWESLEDFQYPLCLPVSHPDYPCSSGVREDLSIDRKRARERICYGKPDEFTAEPIPIYNSGTVTIPERSPVVKGDRTKWGDHLVGSVFKVDGDLAAYTIITIISHDKLILSRNYAGPARFGSAYVIQKDDFGELHDLLVHLVSKDIASTPMADRFIPSTVYSAGTVSVEEKSPTILTGSGTDWTSALAGLTIQFISYSDGSISLRQGSPLVYGYGTSWGTDLAGMVLHIPGVWTEYLISKVDPYSQQLVLTSNYREETEPGISYTYTIVERPDYTISSVDSSAQKLTIDREYMGTKVGVKKYRIFANLEAKTETAGGINPRTPYLNPLDLVLLSSLHPAVAQMLGLYWVDKTALPGQSYDYLLVADYTGAGEHDPVKILNLVRSDFDQINAYIAYNIKAAHALPLPAPEDVKCYALPGGTFNNVDRTNNVGLRWKLNVIVPGVPASDSAIMYNVWRSQLGNETLAGLEEGYHLVTDKQPVGVSSSIVESDVLSQRAGDWPPFPVYFIDNGLEDGWYRYRISGIDIFGRHSATSAAGQWYQWTPVPDPQPWYYRPPASDTAINPSAIRLLDMVPPPPPTAIEAYALDPADTTVLKDDAYNKWWNALIESRWYKMLSLVDKKNLIGLRVRWKWTKAHRRQAPDIREFRIYYHPNRINVLLGTILDVKNVTTTETEVQTDIPNTHPENAFQGTWLRIGSESFTVVGSYASKPLRLRVKNLGRTYARNSISVTKGSNTASGIGTNWDDGLAGLSLQILGEPEIYVIAKVDPPTQLTLSNPYSGAVDGTKTYMIFEIRPPANVPCTLAIPDTYFRGTISVEEGSSKVTGKDTAWNEYLKGMTMRVDGELTSFTVTSVVSPTELVLNRNFDGKKGSGKTYSIRFPLFVDYTISTNWQQRLYVVGYNEHVTASADGRQYDVFLPAAGSISTTGLPLKPSLSEPIVYAHVGVSAADKQKLTPDASKWSGGDWGGRYGNESHVGFPPMVFRVLREQPPTPTPPPDSEKVFATRADYHGHSFYTYRWRPGAYLKTHIFRALDDSVFKIDWSLRPRTFPLRSADWQFFPSELEDRRWDLRKRQQVADELNVLDTFDKKTGKTLAMTYYNKLTNDAMRVLAGLPGNDRAFTQLTLHPLDPNDPVNFDKRGPDSPDGYKPDSKLRSYVDTLDGRSTNRYFYRAAFLDLAHNRSELSLSSPPVWLHKVVAPRVPMITKVYAGDIDPSEPGDRKITITWTSNRETDLKEYRIYRTDKEENAKDLRLMTHIHTESISPDPITRPAEVAWTDKDVPGLMTFYYNLVAVNKTENVSLQSDTISARAFDETFPIAALPAASWVDIRGTWQVRITWFSTDETLLQRRNASFGPWIDLIQWRSPGSHSVLDPDVNTLKTYNYRIRARRTTGAIATSRFVSIQFR